MLPDRQKIRQHLRRMIFIRQTVPNRDSGIFCQRLNALLFKAAILDAVEHFTKDTRGIRDAFLLAKLAGTRIKIGRIHAKIMRCDFK